MARVREDALKKGSSFCPTLCAVSQRSVTSSALRSVKRGTSLFGVTRTCMTVKNHVNVLSQKHHQKDFRVFSIKNIVQSRFTRTLRRQRPPTASVHAWARAILKLHKYSKLIVQVRIWPANHRWWNWACILFITHYGLDRGVSSSCIRRSIRPQLQ